MNGESGPASPELLRDWVDRLRGELGISPEVDITAVLSLAGAAAHAVTRPAAPLTTYLLGYATASAAADGADAGDAFRMAVERVRAAVEAHEGTDRSPGGPNET